MSLSPLNPFHPFTFPTSDNRYRELISGVPFILTEQDPQFAGVAQKHPTSFYWHVKTRVSDDKIQVKELKFVTVIDPNESHRGVWLEREDAGQPEPTKSYEKDGKGIWCEEVMERVGEFQFEVNEAKLESKVEPKAEAKPEVGEVWI